MTDEQMRMAKNVIAFVGKSEGLEDLYRKKAMDTTNDPENWIQVLLIDMILVGIPCLLHRDEKGKEEDGSKEFASSHLTAAIGALALLAQDITISETDFCRATSALSMFAAIMLRANGHGKCEEVAKEVYIKNENKNPLW
jgi:hypothetical protein